ncbi:c-type cytochrome [Parapedobacter sp. 10938]|uniref:c-type cytochrome n=1 Tax=Parapedobacter flavus TaxID=3110225 RepID=UPI002DBAA2A8|nr:c-type cytochrome [Parapedobacter sp. 10938]MEC3879989.1 c-type cytochrome [Parapedobacter sp. 10938]
MTYRMIAAVVAVFAGIFALSSFAPETQPQPQEWKATNLKVLPKNITQEEIKQVMDEFKVALGVKCGFCHAQSATDPKKLDFASDDNHHKETARWMMKMTQRINKKHFKRRDEKTGELTQITCITCHNGKEHPATVTR